MAEVAGGTFNRVVEVVLGRVIEVVVGLVVVGAVVVGVVVVGVVVEVVIDVPGFPAPWLTTTG